MAAGRDEDKPPFVPFPILAAVVIAGVAYVGLMRTSYGAILRGSGGNAVAIAPRRLVAAEGQDDLVRAWPACSACWRAWRSSA